MDRYTMRKRIIATSLNKKRFLSGVFLTLLATVVNAQPFPYQQAGLPVSQLRILRFLPRDLLISVWVRSPSI